MPLTKLNQEQLSSATAPLGYNLVIASAGTGKTSTIVGRIAHLLNSGIKPEEILLLTFTNKASEEMIKRASVFFDNANKIAAGTFHSVCYKWLRRLNKNITLKSPTDLKILFKSIYDKRSFHHLATTPYQSSYLYDLYSLFLNSDASNFREWLIQKNPPQEECVLIYEGIIEEYEEKKSQYNLVDFNSLIKMMIDQLQQGIPNPYKEILVDEYQDTNPLQNKFINSVQRGSLFCVGDYDQSIYAFNGADISIISSFQDRYPNANVYTLTKNYRSYAQILDIANKVIQNNPRIYPKTLEVVRGKAPQNPKVLGYSDTTSQYKDIAHLIAQLPVAYEEIAVLFRNNSSADSIEAYLRELNIPTQRKGGISFFDTKEIKITLDLLTFITNPHDVMSFIHIFEYARGVGSAIAHDIYEALKILGDNDAIKGFLAPNNKKHVFQNRQKATQLGLFDDFMVLGSVSKFRDLHLPEEFLKNPILKHPKLTKEGGAFLYDFYLFLKHIRNFKNPSSIFDETIKSNVFNHIIDNLCIARSKNKLSQVNKEKYDQAKSKILNKLAILKNLLRNYASLESFLNAMILGSNEFTPSKGVNLLTVHASKGLEFKEVFVVDLMQKRFPNEKLSASAGGIEEERRLFYVATTRAKDMLYLTFAKRDNIKNIDYQPSMFLKEAGFKIKI
ncbi:MAG: ATP-dependent helicase [Epsilonproteobacteria bacterium]|nr:ATP-dependent helicase [Campylobacterota bacterium]